MVYTVSITSQGQMSIPVKLRRALNLDKMKKALVTLEDGKIIVEPVGDILDLKGSVKSNQPLNPRKMRADFETYLAQEAIK